VEIGQKSENMVAKKGAIPYFAEKCTVMVVFKCRGKLFLPRFIAVKDIFQNLNNIAGGTVE
jgi:hypothetical protein